MRRDLFISSPNGGTYTTAARAGAAADAGAWCTHSRSPSGWGKKNSAGAAEGLNVGLTDWLFNRREVGPAR